MHLLTRVIISSLISCRRTRTLLADSLFAMRRLIALRSADVKPGSSASPMYITGRPTFLRLLAFACIQYHQDQKEHHHRSPAVWACGLRRQLLLQYLFQPDTYCLLSLLETSKNQPYDAVKCYLRSIRATSY